MFSLLIMVCAEMMRFYSRLKLLEEVFSHRLAPDARKQFRRLERTPEIPGATCSREVLSYRILLRLESGHDNFTPDKGL
jgi:hypothetical protein